MLNRVLISFLLFVSIPFFSMGQDQPLRIELECQQGVEPYVSVPCGVYGALIMYPTLEENENSVVWTFMLVDVNFKLVWSVPYNIGKDLKFRHQELEEETLYLAFSKSGKTNEETNLQILRIELPTGKSSDLKATIEGRPQASQMKASRNAVVVGIEKSKGSANIIYFDFNTQTKTHVPFILTDDHRLLNIDFNNETNQYCIISSYEPKKYTQSLNCIFWNPLSTTYDSIAISGFQENNVVQHAQWVHSGDSINIIIGGYLDNYRSRNGYMDDYGTRYSGLFSYDLNNNISLTFFPLADLNNIIRLLSVNDIQTSRKNKKRQEDKKNDINLFLVFHDIQIHGSEIILLVENYRPQFHTVSSMAYDYYGRPLTTYYDVFDGYRYTNAIVCAFDAEGKISWTNDMDIRDVTVDKNKQISTIVQDNEYYVMAFAGIGNVASQVIMKDEIIDEITITKVDHLFSKDRLMETGTATISHWYGQYFLVDGYQTIQNSRVTESGKRTVFYLNKMAYK